jgi:hypothetical protein
MAFLIKLVLGLAVLILGLAFFQNWRIENSENQQIFARNSAPNPALNGFYEGKVGLPIKLTWVGKDFNSASTTGSNVFDDGSHKYPFTTNVVTVGSSTVLNINYDLPENPFWVRMITDQVVQTGPEHYLGKITLRLIPNVPLSLGFFRLQR